jgi:hypothetical protein
MQKQGVAVQMHKKLNAPSTSGSSSHKQEKKHARNKSATSYGGTSYGGTSYGGTVSKTRAHFELLIEIDGAGSPPDEEEAPAAGADAAAWCML